jgi:hypothetical protein
MMMMILKQMDIHVQYLKLSMKKYLLNENQNEMSIVVVYLLLIFVLKMMMMMMVVVLVHWMIWMIEVYAIGDVMLNWQDN